VVGRGARTKRFETRPAGRSKHRIRQWTRELARRVDDQMAGGKNDEEKESGRLRILGRGYEAARKAIDETYSG
jgi:hypothetical protein